MGLKYVVTRYNPAIKGWLRLPHTCGFGMLIRFANLKLTAVVLLGVVALFFFPAPRGSFVSTHGPVTSVESHADFAGLAVLSAVVADAKFSPSGFYFVRNLQGVPTVWPLLVPFPAFTILRI